MSEDKEKVVPMEDEDDDFLPEGWTGSDDEDFFDPSTWGAKDGAADAQDDSSDEGEGNSDGGDEDSPTTGDDDTDTTDTEDEDEDPTTDDDDSTDGKLHFTAVVDHVTQDVELDPADLPAVYQKSLMLDRYQKRISDMEAELAKWDSLAAGLKYEDRTALHDGLFEAAVQDFVAEHPSVPEEMARDFVTRQFGAKQPTKQQAPAEESKPTRDFQQEVSDLFRAFPDARNEKIPDEVTNSAISRNIPLLQAYSEWKAKTASATASRVQRENKILKQNQAAAKRAPVSRVTGGGNTNTSPDDPFLKGFNEDSAW